MTELENFINVTAQILIEIAKRKYLEVQKAKQQSEKQSA